MSDVQALEPISQESLISSLEKQIGLRPDQDQDPKNDKLSLVRQWLFYKGIPQNAVKTARDNIILRAYRNSAYFNTWKERILTNTQPDEPETDANFNFKRSDYDLGEEAIGAPRKSRDELTVQHLNGILRRMNYIKGYELDEKKLQPVLNLIRRKADDLETASRVKPELTIEDLWGKDEKGEPV